MKIGNFFNAGLCYVGVLTVKIRKYLNGYFGKLFFGIYDSQIASPLTLQLPQIPLRIIHKCFGELIMRGIGVAYFGDGIVFEM